MSEKINVLCLEGEAIKSDFSGKKLLENKGVKLQICENIEDFFNELGNFTNKGGKVVYLDDTIVLDKKTRKFLPKIFGRELKEIVEEMQEGIKAGEVIAEFINTNYQVAILLHTRLPNFNKKFPNEENIEVVRLPAKSTEIFSKIKKLAENHS